MLVFALSYWPSWESCVNVLRHGAFVASLSAGETVSLVNDQLLSILSLKYNVIVSLSCLLFILQKVLYLVQIYCKSLDSLRPPSTTMVVIQAMTTGTNLIQQL